MVPFIGKVPITIKGNRRIVNAQSMRFYLRYDSPEGWTTYSPLLTLTPNKLLIFNN